MIEYVLYKIFLSKYEYDNTKIFFYVINIVG